MEAKYKPGDIVLTRVKIKSVTHTDEGKTTYSCRPVSGAGYSAMELEEGDIRGISEDKLTD